VAMNWPLVSRSTILFSPGCFDCFQGPGVCFVFIILLLLEFNSGLNPA